MKYGLLIDFGTPQCNFGDLAQAMAIEYLYGLMGIPKDEVVYITAKDLGEYDGEQLLLPYSYVVHLFGKGKNGSVLLSDKITPVFLGVSMGFTIPFNNYPMKNYADPEKKWIEMFRKHAPVGCRDDYMRRFLLEQKVPAYLQSCITNSLPRRPDGNYKKVLLVDCPTEVLPYIPKELLANAEVMSNTEHMGNLSVEENYQKVKKRYEYYRDNASLIVTSRYHAAVPCNAMGIPVIFLRFPFDKPFEDIRLDAIHPYIQLYSGDEYDKINWYPEWQDFSELRTGIAHLAIARIREAYERHTQTERILKFFQPRVDDYKNIVSSEITYKARLRDFILKYYAPPASGSYYIWGAIQWMCDGDKIVLEDFIKEINPDLQFAGWIDTFKTGKMANVSIISPDKINLDDNLFVIVGGEVIIPDALERFEKMELHESQYLILANTTIEKADLEGIKRALPVNI